MTRWAIPVLTAGLLLVTPALAAGGQLQLADNDHKPTSHNPPGGGGAGTGATGGHGTTEQRNKHIEIERNVTVHKNVTVHTNEVVVHKTAPGFHGNVVVYKHDSHGFGIRPSNWNNRPRVVDRAFYQRNFNAPRRFHFGFYRRPPGWHYRRWGYGEMFPRAFWARDYWIDSWWMFDLPIPPYGYQWVRYGDDAVLIDLDTGQILEVEYGVFD